MLLLYMINIHNIISIIVTDYYH